MKMSEEWSYENVSGDDDGDDEVTETKLE